MTKSMHEFKLELWRMKSMGRTGRKAIKLYRGKLNGIFFNSPGQMLMLIEQLYIRAEKLK